MGVEIERKFTIKELPEDLEQYPCHIIEQGYLNVFPAIRVRREDDHYYMTYKGNLREIMNDGSDDEPDTGIGKTEYNMPLNEDSYAHLIAKADGNVIRKKRYLLPINSDAFAKESIEADKELKDALDKGNIKIELDIFEAPFEGRLIAEVEFPSEESASVYRPAGWFKEDVTGDPAYSNACMSAERLG